MSPPTEEEEKYFKRLEAEQRDRLRRKLEESARQLQAKQAIAASVRTDDLELAERIKALGFDGQTARVFDLLPLIHVAWADGRIQRRERAAILQVLEARGIAPGSEAFTMVESLLEARPSQAYLEQSLAVLRDLMTRKGETAQPESIVDMCVAVAGASGGFLGLGGTIGERERALVDRIAEELGEPGQAELRRRLKEK